MPHTSLNARIKKSPPPPKTLSLTNTPVLDHSLFACSGDFGISKIMMGETACAHSIVGTPSYLPPEVCQDKPYNKKVDVWALGCVLYEMCTLKHAFRGSSVAAITIKILRCGAHAHHQQAPACHACHVYQHVCMCVCVY